MNEILVHYLNSNVSSIILEFIIIKPPLYLVEVAKYQLTPTFHSTHSSKLDAYNTIHDKTTLDWNNFGYISVVYEKEKLRLLEFNHYGITKQYDLTLE